MAEITPLLSSQLFLRIIRFGNPKIKFDSQAEDKIIETNDKGSGCEKTFVYAKQQGEMLFVRLPSEENNSDNSYSKVDLSDGLSLDEMRALGFSNEKIEALKIVARGMALEDDILDVDNDMSVISDSDDLPKFWQAVKSFSIGNRFTTEQSLYALLVLFTGKVGKPTRKDHKLRDERLKEIEALIYGKCSESKNTEQFLAEASTALGINDPENIVLKNIKGYIEANSLNMSDPSDKMKAVVFISISVIGSIWPEAFQREELGFKHYLTTSFEGELTFDRIAEWVKSFDAPAETEKPTKAEELPAPALEDLPPLPLEVLPPLPLEILPPLPLDAVSPETPEEPPPLPPVEREKDWQEIEIERRRQKSEPVITAATGLIKRLREGGVSGELSDSIHKLRLAKQALENKYDPKLAQGSDFTAGLDALNAKIEETKEAYYALLAKQGEEARRKEKEARDLARTQTIEARELRSSNRIEALSRGPFPPQIQAKIDALKNTFDPDKTSDADHEQALAAAVCAVLVQKLSLEGATSAEKRKALQEIEIYFKTKFLNNPLISMPTLQKIHDYIVNVREFVFNAELSENYKKNSLLKDAVRELVNEAFSSIKDVLLAVPAEPNFERLQAFFEQASSIQITETKASPQEKLAEYEKWRGSPHLMTTIRLRINSLDAEIKYNRQAP